MPSLDAALASLTSLVRLAARIEQDREQNRTDANLSRAFRDERDADLEQQALRVGAEQQRLLEELLRYPPYHDRHFSKLAKFQAGAGSFEKSVFIMTKFPEKMPPEPAEPGTLDAQLEKVIASVRAAITACGYIPRMASDATFHSMLWDNVELYLLGCQRGIAILESRYKPELNPNVAMEWGWMRGMGREILPLVDKNFAYRRADWGGLLESVFDWDDPGAAIPAAVKAWLTT